MPTRSYFCGRKAHGFGPSWTIAHRRFISLSRWRAQLVSFPSLTPFGMRTDFWAGEAYVALRNA